LGEEVSFVPGPAADPGSGSGLLRARLVGIDERGALLLERPGGGIESFVSGELRT
jgi:biotin-(acetyl-CoA carboxylase) ligase